MKLWKPIFLMFFLSGCALWSLPDNHTPAEELAAAEVDFQGIQMTIQLLAEADVITPAMAPCVSDANKALHAALAQSRGAVKLGITGAGTIVGSFNAALLSLRGVITKIEAGTYTCRSPSLSALSSPS